MRVFWGSLQALCSLVLSSFSLESWDCPFTLSAPLVGGSYLGGPFAEGRAKELPPGLGTRGRFGNDGSRQRAPGHPIAHLQLLLETSCAEDAAWQKQSIEGWESSYFLVLDLHPGGLLLGGEEIPALLWGTRLKPLLL